MTSIYKKQLGKDFENLHPQIQKRFGFSSEDGIASIGRGIMERVWHGKWYTLPFLWLGAWRNAMFPTKGTNVPFLIENYAYQDSYGRETVTWVRTFHFPHVVRRFDATMIYSEKRKRIVDYLGNKQHLAVDIDMRPAANGGMSLRSGKQRFYEGPMAFSFPMLFSGVADVCEWFDDEAQKFRIEVKVHNKRWGPLFGYSGSFDVEYLTVTGKDVPADVKPKREEQRE